MSAYRFGPFEFDSESGDLNRDGELIRLRRQPATLLSALLARGGRLLTRDEIAGLLWDDHIHVDTDGGINFVVKQLRQALDDSAAGSALIETLPRRGYRLMVPVEALDATAPALVATRNRPGHRPALIAAPLVIVGIALAAVMAPRPSPSHLRLLVQLGTDAAGRRYYDRDAFREMIVADLTAPGSLLEVIDPAIADDYLDRPFSEARQSLSLDLLLHVSVRDDGGHPLLHAKLVRASDGAVLWSVNRGHQADALRFGARSIAQSIAGSVVSTVSSRRGGV